MVWLMLESIKHTTQFIVAQTGKRTSTEYQTYINQVW